ncbi:unnamed protein product [Dibothriocephalus latus]|uniref:Fibronectin type-III domain-containing protein n=1 Tax=Dibothriocephalus latus TaxID=60516 RepID=A0A3P6TAF8_DIBLA|nr:unnamed protein product [Dibothriocephalus latus]
MRRESATSGQVDGPQSDYIVLELKWNPPADTYGELKGYQVSYRLIGPPELLQEEAVNSGGGGGSGGHAERTPQTHAVRRNVTDTSYTSTQIDNIRLSVDLNDGAVNYTLPVAKAYSGKDRPNSEIPKMDYAGLNFCECRNTIFG